VVDGITYISFRQAYLDCGDPTEYEQAMALTGSVEHWKTLCESPFFKEHLVKWRLELKEKLKSEQVMRMQDLAENGNDSVRIQATKWLFESPWEEETPTRGRPSKEERKAHLKVITEDEAHVAEDLARINIRGR